MAGGELAAGSVEFVPDGTPRTADEKVTTSGRPGTVGV
jgi:hypothetical protein